MDYDLLFRWFLGMRLMKRSFDPTVFTKNRQGLLEHQVGQQLFDNGATDWVNRAQSYTEIDRCDLAIEDAKTALALEPASGPGSHTDVEANTILYLCYFIDDNMTAALQHVDAALSLAEEHSYPPEEISQMSEARDQIMGN